MFMLKKNLVSNTISKNTGILPKMLSTLNEIKTSKIMLLPGTIQNA